MHRPPAPAALASPPRHRHHTGLPCDSSSSFLIFSFSNGTFSLVAGDVLRVWAESCALPGGGPLTGPDSTCNPRRGQSSALVGNVKAKGAKGGLYFPLSHSHSFFFLFFPFFSPHIHYTLRTRTRAHTQAGVTVTPHTHINTHTPSRSKIRSDRYVFSAMFNTG